MITRTTKPVGDDVVFFTDENDYLWALYKVAKDHWVCTRQWKYASHDGTASDVTVYGSRTPGADDRACRPWRWATADDVPVSWVAVINELQ